jgi:2-polyprenyl-3-methyl-5-hydroxy-6-metoxy-1,4-benzoquinol methylase
LTSLGDNASKNSYTENANFWIKIIRERLDRYRTDLTDRAVLDAIGPVDGLSILDAGCGEGYLSRRLAQDGARVVGIDACADLVQSAQDAAERNGLSIDYRTGTVDNLLLASDHFDVVVSNHLLNDLPSITNAIREFARVTRTGGRLVILMLHPCFYGANAERIAVKTYPGLEYFQVRTIEQTFKVAGIESPAKVRMWFRPLEDYISQLVTSGFHITTLSEPHPSPDQLAKDPWWRDNFVRPLFMLIVATKGP